MSDAVNALPLLGLFADFHEDVASLRRAQGQGRLGSMLAAGGPVPASGSELALAASARLSALLDDQRAAMLRDGGPQLTDAVATAQYAMAALADEIFILELDWPGREAWLEVLLEHRQFKSRSAGRHLYELARQLIDSQRASPLQADLAAVFLLTLQLGFKGRLRGSGSGEELAGLRRALYQPVKHGGAGLTPEHRPGAPFAFPAAYDFLLGDDSDARLAPLAPWLMLGARALGAYLLLSLLVWLAVLYLPLPEAAW